MKETTTDRLTDVLMNASAAEAGDFLEGYREKLAEEERPFAAFMRRTLRAKGIRQQDVFLAADISEGYGYKLISQEKLTRRRDVILRLCLAGRLDLHETQQALKLYGMSPLYPRIPRDAVLIIAVNTGLRDMEAVDDLLRRHGMAPLTCCAEAE